MKRIAIFASGGGSNFRAIYYHIQKGNIPGEIVLVVSNNPQCGAIFFAIEQGFENFILNYLEIDFGKSVHFMSIACPVNLHLHFQPIFL